MHKPEIISELTQISKTLAANPVPSPYSPPPGYFDQLPETILRRIKALETPTPQNELATLSPLLSRINKQMPFALPETYFENLAATTAELASDPGYESPLLQSLRNKSTYELPAGYFDGLPQAIMQRVAAPAARVIPMSFGRRLARYGVAAAIATVVAVSGWFWMQKSNGLSQKGELAGINKVSNRELQEFLDQNTLVMPDNIVQASNEIKTEDVKTMLAGVPDADLQQYLEQQPNLKDPATTNFN